MTKIGKGTLFAALAVVSVSMVLNWPSLLIVGGMGIVVVTYGFVSTRTIQPIEIHRSLHPKKVTKGNPSVALLNFTNQSSRPSKRINVVQHVGGDDLVATLPPLLARQASLKSVSLPTKRRGHFSVGPVTIRKADPFGMFVNEKYFGEPEELWVQPSIARLRPISRGKKRDLEGPTSDKSPVGNIAFHRIREYVAGDDPRFIDWKATARRSSTTLELMVRHNVDTTMPATVVLLDNSRSDYSEFDFETIVDVAASAVRTALFSGGNVDLLTT